MAAGSVVGAILGALLLGVIANLLLIPALVFLLLSAVKLWRHPVTNHPETADSPVALPSRQGRVK